MYGPFALVSAVNNTVMYMHLKFPCKDHSDSRYLAIEMQTRYTCMLRHSYTRIETCMHGGSIEGQESSINSSIHKQY